MSWDGFIFSHELGWIYLVMSWDGFIPSQLMTKTRGC